MPRFPENNAHNESVEKVLDDQNQRNLGGLLPLRRSEIVQYSAFYALDISAPVTNILSSGFFYSLNNLSLWRC